MSSDARLVRNLIVLGALVGAGCMTNAQRSAVREFSVATAVLGDVASSEFVAMRKSTIEMNLVRLALDPDPEPPGHSNLDGSFDIDAVEARVRAAETLKTYGELLLSLATDTQADEIRNASDRFVPSVAGLGPDDQKLTDERAQALGAIVNTIGGWVVEYKKARAMKRVIADASPQVRHLCGLLKRDFDPEGVELATGFRQTADALEIAADDALDDGARRGEHAAARGAYMLATENAARVETVWRRASVSSERLATAQSALEAAMLSRQPSLVEIKSFTREAQSLLAALKVLG